MNRRIASVLLATAAAMIVIGGSVPPSGTARAQGGFFGAQRVPAIEVDTADNLYLMMSVATAPASEHRPHSQIFFTMSRNGGTDWDNEPQTRNLSNSRGEAFGPSLAVGKNIPPRLYVTYHDNSSGTTQAYLLSTKKKTKFRKPANITPHNGGAFAPRVALDSTEAVNVVWGDTKNNLGTVLFLRSTDLGFTFTAPVNVSRSSGVAFDPKIAVDPDDGINVAWQDTAPGRSVIMFSRSTDGGETFSNPKQLSTGTGAATEAGIASDAAGNLNVVWADESTGSAQAYYSRSTDHGQTFSAPLDVSRIPDGDVHKPTVVTFRDVVYVAFQNGDLFGEEQVKNKQVYITTSENAGASFGDIQQVSRAKNNVGRAHSPSMAVDSRGVLHIVWIDASIIGNDEGLLFYSRSSNGRQFSEQRMILAVI